MDDTESVETHRTSYRHVVALGSSFAAGPGIAPVVDRAAMRSASNYAHLLAAKLGAELTDLTVSGATVKTITEARQRTVLGKSFAPQVHGVRGDADLVTITAGGNDVGYAPSLLRAAAFGWLRESSLTRPISRLLGASGRRSPSASDLRRVSEGLARIVEEVRDRAPDARILLVNYLTVLGPEATPSREVPLTVEEIVGFREFATGLAGAFAAAAERSGADLLDAATLSADHGLGSAQPWVTGFRITMRPMPFHPNAAGMRAVADEIYRVVTRGNS